MKFFVSFVLLVATVELGDLRPYVGAQTGADFSRTVFVGDSLTAGFQDGALHAEGQLGSYPVLVARSIGAPIVMPLIDEPGVPNPNPASFTGLLLLPSGACSPLAVQVASGRSSGRVDPSARATDVAVPGQDMEEALTAHWSIDPTDPATIDTIEDLILGLPAALEGETPASQIETAVRLDPTFVVVWLGSNDALGAALQGTVNDDTLTPLADFRESATQVFEALAATGAAGVIINVPDVTISPGLFSVADIRVLLASIGISLSPGQIRGLFGLEAGSQVLLTGVLSIASGQRPTAEQVLTKSEIKKIRRRTRQYNDVLRAEADARGWAYVDAYGFLKQVDREGYPVPGFGTLTTDYLGGVFSLDGVHPTDTAQALIAGLVIDAINAKYGTGFVGVDLAAIAAGDPETCNRERRGSARTGLTLPEALRLAELVER